MKALLRGFGVTLALLAALTALYAAVNELLAPALYALFAWALSLGDVVATIMALLLVALALSVVAAADTWWRGLHSASRRG